MQRSEKAKLISVITRYCIEEFAEANWFELGQLTEKLDLINAHPRLLRSMSFGDDDYDYCATEVVSKIIGNDDDTIALIIDHFDIDLWYQNKEPKKYERVFGVAKKETADFWSERNLRVFISHLSSSKDKAKHLAAALQLWGLETFVAHEDIEPSREWMVEVEKALLTMDVLLAIVENGFKESNWCDQEVGFALGRRIDVIPLRAGMDPYGFFGKYQGLQIKGRYPTDVAEDLVKLMLRKQNLYGRVISNITSALGTASTDKKISIIQKIDEWKLVKDDDLKSIIESMSIPKEKRKKINHILDRVGAYNESEIVEFDDDIPF